MDARLGNAAAITNTFEPSFDLIQEEDCNTLLLYLPGFTKEQLRVQLSRTRVLKISGLRPIGENKWSSFQKDFPVSENVDTNKISAKFEDGILYVRQPKMIVPADAEKEDKKIPPSTETPHPPKPDAAAPQAPKADPQPPKPAAAPLAPKANPERPPTTNPSVDESKQKAAKDIPGKSGEKPVKKEEKVREPEGGKKEERNYVEGKTGKSTDGDDRRVATSAGRSDGDKHEKVSGADVYATARLKVGRKKMMKILLFLCAFALGVYVSKLRWFSTTV